MRDIRYSLNDIIHQEAQNVVSQVYTTIPAIVKSFDSTKQTITAQVAVNTPTYFGSYIPAGTYYNIPVVYQSGQDWVMYGPLQDGDAVVLLIPHQGIEDYLSGPRDKVADPARVERFEINDAVAISGMFTRSNPTRKEAYKDIMHIAQGDNVIAFDSEEGITIDTGSAQVVLNNATGTTITVGSSIITINPSGAIGITGNVTITGNLIVTGSVTSATNITGGIPMLAHTHAYTDNGAPLFTGVPV